ncbi:hypothetical protein PhCBS80983_g06358 [Powellomyces hirtus]|uniref:Chromo domain-containing protein n=1 Tax=Powellomyces hirtus TaxID=109895 RepID=A0A507DPL5_9FUNG|nr:hypothetical protein PhCBS80983_g06358 [Powellomyces hirtus]
MAIESCHDDLLAGHLGRDRTLQKVQESYWWPDWHSDVVNHVKSCTECSEHKPLPKNRVGPLTPFVVNDPWEKIGIDIVGKLPTTARGNNYIVILTDYMTKWVEAFAVPDITANRVSRRLVEDVFCRFAYPEASSPTEGNLLSTNTPTDILEEAPTSIEMRDYRVETQLRLQKAWALARENIKNAQKTQKTWYDRVSHMKDYGFHIGDKVWLTVPQFTKSARKENETAVEKMAVKWTGPHRIISCNRPTFKLLETLSPTEVILRQAHVRRLRYWTERRPVDSEENPSLTQQEILEEELKLAETANKLTRKPFRPKEYGTSQELTQRGIDPDEDSDHEIDGIEGEDAYEVEKIVNHRDTNNGREFLVKWKYWPAKHNTWETSMARSCPQATRVAASSSKKGGRGNDTTAQK